METFKVFLIQDINRSNNHPTNKKLRTFFSNNLEGMRINTNKKPHECGA